MDIKKSLKRERINAIVWMVLAVGIMESPIETLVKGDSFTVHSWIMSGIGGACLILNLIEFISASRKLKELDREK